MDAKIVAKKDIARLADEGVDSVPRKIDAHVAADLESQALKRGMPSQDELSRPGPSCLGKICHNNSLGSAMIYMEWEE